MPVTSVNFGPSFVNQNYYKHQTVYVYAPDGKTFIDVLRDAPLLAGFKETINSGTSPLRVRLPRSFDFYDQAGVINSRGTIAQGNVVKYYLFGPTLPQLGLLRFQGSIDTVEPEINDKGEESVTITLVPFSSILGDHGITQDIQFSLPNQSNTYQDAVLMMKWFFFNKDVITGQTYTYPLTWDATNPTSSGNAGSQRFSNQTVGSIFDSLILMMPANWYYRINPDLSVTVNVPPLTATHTLYVGKNISNPQYRMDWSNLKNVVVFQGGTLNGTTTGTVTGNVTNGSVTNGSASGSINGSITGGSFSGSGNTGGGSFSGSGNTSGGSISGSANGSASLNVSGSTASGSISLGLSGSASSQSVNVSGSTSSQSVNVSGGISGNVGGSFSGGVNGGVSGNINGVAVITTVPMQVVKTGNNLATFGERLVYQNDSRVTDANTLNILALGLLQQLNRYTIRTRVRVPDLSGIAGMGYPIDIMKVGDTVLVIDPTAPNSQQATLWDVAQWDVDTWDFKIGVNLKTSLFDHVLPIVAIDYGFDYVDIELDSLMPNLSRSVYKIQQQFGDYTMGSIRTAASSGATVPTIQV
jgi:hypothetical protein